MKKFAVCVVLVALMSGCFRPVDTPVYVDITNSETPFLIQMEGDNEQATMKSEEYLKEKMVATKRVQISYRWVPTGRSWQYRTGYYMPNEQLIVVDRQPVSREWTADANSGTNSQDQAIWVESSDSVGFSTGISITARIENADDAVLFLYNYPADPDREVQVTGKAKAPYKIMTSGLVDVMDSEIRPKIQEVLAEEAAMETMDDLRPKKNEMIAQVREVVIPFFAERGITITTIGMFGGFAYENPAIQAAIDKVFEAQQDEEVAKAETTAAEARKEALKLKGEGEANQLVEAAKGKAEGIKVEAEAEAAAIQAVADAKAYELEKLTSNPEAYMALKELEVKMERAKVWNGEYPTTYFGSDLGIGDSGVDMLLSMPTAE